MKIRFVDLIINLLALVYILFSINLILNEDAIKYLIFLSRILLFVVSLSFIFLYHKKSILIFLAFFIFLLLYGFINGNWINYIFYDSLSSFVLVFILILTFENRDILTKKIIEKISLILPIGTFCVIYYFSSNSLEAAESVVNRIIFEVEDGEESFRLTDGIALIQPSILLLPFIWYLDTKRKIFLLFGFSVYFVVSFMIISRAGIAGAFLSIFLTFLIGLKEKFIRFNIKFLASSVLLLLLCSTTFIRYSENILDIAEIFNLRFQGIETEDLSSDAVKEEPRDIEAREYFNSIQFYEFIIGKGMGAANPYPFGKFSERGMMMMHRGENNLILKGGLILLFIIYGSAIFSLFKLTITRTYFGYSYVAVILIFLLLERGHQQFSQLFMLLFFTLAISYAMSIKSYKMPFKNDQSLNLKKKHSTDEKI